MLKPDWKVCSKCGGSIKRIGVGHIPGDEAGRLTVNKSLAVEVYACEEGDCRFIMLKQLDPTKGFVSQG
jgi:hypothetical protein